MDIRQSGIGMTSQRTRMRMVERLRAEGITDESVLAVMGALPRHLFVDEALAARAYDDPPLPIGFGQTISSPFIVARMSELLCAKGAPTKVLEIGTGCGYQTAVLGKLCKEVYSVERIAALLEKARARMREQRIFGVRFQHADGNLGLPAAAPFDGILMSAVSPRVPPALVEQLAPGGRMVLPVGTAEQHLYVVERTEKSTVETRHEAVRFVPLMHGVE